MQGAVLFASLAATTVALGACAAPEAEDVAEAPFSPAYLGVETLLEEGDLINLGVRMTGARGDDDVAAYAECAAVGLAQSRGFGFVRHVRTLVTQDDEIWQADAAFLVSAARPLGLVTLETAAAAKACADRGIPVA